MWLLWTRLERRDAHTYVQALSQHSGLSRQPTRTHIRHCQGAHIGLQAAGSPSLYARLGVLRRRQAAPVDRVVALPTEHALAVARLELCKLCPELVELLLHLCQRHVTLHRRGQRVLWLGLGVLEPCEICLCAICLCEICDVELAGYLFGRLVICSWASHRCTAAACP